MLIALLRAALVVAIGLSAAHASAQGIVDHHRAAQVKAAYLRYIAEFTSWPDHAFAGSKGAIVIGLVGEDAYGVGQLMEDAIAKKRLSAQQRRLEFVRLPELPDPASGVQLGAQARGCHVIFISHSVTDPWNAWRSLLDGHPIMTVSEMHGFSQSDGMIEFVISAESGRVTMHIDLATVSRARLRLSARLLGLENVVHIVRRQDEAHSLPGSRLSAPALSPAQGVR